MQEKTLVPTNLLCWPRIKNLIPDHKLIALAIWQNPFITPCGCYFVDVDMLSTMVGFNKINVQQAISDLEGKKLVIFDEETSEILVCDWWRFHQCQSPKQVSMIQTAVDKIQSDRLKDVFFEQIKHVSNKIIDLRSNYNKTEPNSNTTTTDDAEAASEPTGEAIVGSGGKLIFDKAIDQNLHQQLTALLENVQPILAQSMLNTLAQKILDGERNEKFRVGNALNLIAYFINVKFDPTAGIAISKSQQRAAAETEKRKLESEQKNRPYKNPADGKISCTDYLKGKEK